MEPKVEFSQQPQFRSGTRHGELGFGLDEIHGMMLSGAAEAGVSSSSSFTALLELPPPQAVELLVNDGDFAAKPPLFPSNLALIDRASRLSVFADSSQEKSVKKVDSVKREPLDSDSNRNSASPAVSNQSLKSAKRKDREKKVKESKKKSKGVAANEASEEDKEKLPYVHVRARRGQATDSHSLAERARREKINARMKLLQELVPGCNKISGTAMVLDEIINHVQTLQRQVEFLSMRLAAVNPRIDFNFDALVGAESGPSVGSTSLGMLPPSVWPEGQISTSRQQQYQQPWHFEGLHQPVWARDDDASNFVTPENSFLSYNSLANSASLHSSQLKMEL